MDEQRARDDTVAACFAHIVLLRKELQWIGETTKEYEIKMKVARALEKSLTMPPGND